jgi:hypothetical protein
MRRAINSNSKWQRTVFWVSFLGIVVFASAVFANPDTKPPYLVNPIPAHGTVTDNWFVIQTGVIDNESGVDPDPDNVLVFINGSPPRVKPIIEPSYGQKNGIRITVILIEENRHDTIVVTVRAQDLAPEPNIMVSEWTFYVDNVTVDPAPILTYPENHRWLEYNMESGYLNYSWLSGVHHEYYRMRFTFSNDTSGTMDLGPFPYNGAFQSESISIELTPDQWELVSELGEIWVDVAPLDQLGGDQLGKYSKPAKISYILDDLPSLVQPWHSAILDSMFPPVFEWTPMNTPIEAYVAVFVRLDEFGQFTEDIKVFETPMFIKTLPMDMTLWNQFESGTWAWAVVPKYASGEYGSFMIYRFTKNWHS